MRDANGRGGSDAAAIGWVSVADALIIGLILLFTVCLMAQGALRTSQAENDRLKTEVGALQGQVARVFAGDPGKMAGRITQLEAELAAANAALDAAKKQLADLDALKRSLADAEDAVKTRTRERDALAAELAQVKAVLSRTAAELIAALEEAEMAKIELGKANAQLTSDRASRQQVNKELLGLKGDLKRVAVVFDRSGSMNDEVSPGLTRWKSAVDLASVWVRNLNVDECVLIMFDNTIEVFPAGGRLYRLSGPDGDKNRERMLAALAGQTPGGTTHTRSALAKAYEYDPDTVILFTDGEPTAEGPPLPGQTDKERAAEAQRSIIAMCARQRRRAGGAPVPVNAVGLGKYYVERNFSEFLLGVAEQTGGVFIGR